ncbi:class II fructose-bisphosphate aldolase [Salinithrix halophila]|uniref:Ketose-bisphosphate aldolase n=1 Tax=Salinithrix halophila TaxID=1485204 RepID=A0ABV8JDB4_9BACL
MALLSTKGLLETAYRNRSAVFAFASHNMELMKTIVEAAEETGSPVILQTTPATLRSTKVKLLAAMARAIAEEARIPVALHLDHGDSFATVAQCLRAGYTSVMIDGSRLPLKENIALTRRVVEMAHPMGVPVEAELGTIVGTEEPSAAVDGQAVFTDPATAETFVSHTGVDFLAPSFGTAHGPYKGEIRLDFPRLAEISRRVSIPLVMHGASGVPENSIQLAIANGVSKINISTELKQAFTQGLRDTLEENPSETDPRKLFQSAKEAVKQVVKQKLNLARPIPG